PRARRPRRRRRAMTRGGTRWWPCSPPRLVGPSQYACLVDDEWMGRDVELHGQVAVVTGAGSGIGRSTARLLARRGASVHVADIDAESVERVSREISSAGGSATAHALDVSDPAAVEALAGAIFASDGHVDILHNNAGIGFGG